MLKPFETERLLLKPLTFEAAHQVLSFYTDNKDFFEPWEPIRGHNFYSLFYHRASLTAEYNLMTEGKLIRYWAFQKDNPEEIIGTICFQNLLREPYLSCVLGYKFSHRYQHLGFAFESIKKSIDIIFQEYNLHRIEAYIMPDNEPSLRLIDRLSFRHEGTAYSYALINAVWTDHKRYSLINPKDILTDSLTPIKN